MTLIYKINDLEKQIPYKQWEALKKEFVEFAKEKKHLEEKEELHLNRIDELTDRVVELETNIDEAIKHIKTHQFIYVSQYEEMSNFDNHLLEILKRGKE